MLPRFALVVAIAVVLGLESRAQDETVPKGAKIDVEKLIVKVENTDKNGRAEVSLQQFAVKENIDLTMPQASWQLGIVPATAPKNTPGVFIKDMLKDSGMRKMRPMSGGPDKNTTSYEAEKGDIVVALDGRKITTSKDITIVLNNAAVPEDVEIVIRDKNSGKLHRYYVSAIAIVK